MNLFWKEQGIPVGDAILTHSPVQRKLYKFIHINREREPKEDDNKTKLLLPLEQSSSHMETPVSPVSSSRCLTKAQEGKTNC